MEKFYRINENGKIWTGAMSLDEIAIMMRVIIARAKMEPEIHKRTPELRIDSITALKQDEVNIVDADRAAMDFINRNGLIAFMKKVIKMTIDECGPNANETYRTVTGKDMVRLGCTCLWCEDKQCANCPAFRK